MTVAAQVGKAIPPGGRDFSLLPRSAPGCGGEVWSDEVPVGRRDMVCAATLRRQMFGGKLFTGFRGDNGPDGNIPSEPRVAPRLQRLESAEAALLHILQRIIKSLFPGILSRHSPQRIRQLHKPGFCVCWRASCTPCYAIPIWVLPCINSPECL